MKTISTLRIGLVLVAAMALLIGCKSESSTHETPGTVHQLKLARPVAPRGLAMFDTDTEHRMSWAQLLNNISYYDTIIVVADNSDPASLAVEHALVQDIFRTHSNPALSVSFLERHEQNVLDAYLTGEVDADTLGAETYSAQRFGGNWSSYMLPMVNEAKAAGSPVYAANAREKYVRLARRDGYAALKAAPQEDENDFSMPRKASSEEREEFGEIISESVPVEEPVDPAWLDNLYFAELVRNQTMADTVHAARKDGHTPVVHINGTISPEFEGGTPWLYGAQHPFSNAVTITILPIDSRRIRPQDRDRGDIVIYTAPSEAAAQ